MTSRTTIASEKGWIDAAFDLSERNTSVSQEIRAASATFLTMSYILLVNPQILSQLGISPTVVVISTAISSAVGSIFAGFFGNLPVGLAPGIGLSAYLTYGLILGDGLSIQEAFTSCFIAGAILLVSSVSGFSQVIMRFIPRSVKLATIVGMGLQIALVGMTSIDLVVPNAQTIVGLGDMYNFELWLAMGGLVLIGSLLYHQVRGGILLGIIIMTVMTWCIEKSFPTQYVQLPDLNIDSTQFISFSNFDWQKCMPGIVAFLFIGVIDVSGCIFGMASLAQITLPDGSVPGSFSTFIAVAVSTMVSAVTGGTPVIVYVESATGIKEGGRTGLTAILIGVFFLLSLFFAPVLSQIPITATAPVTILVGAIMMSQAVEIDWNNMSEAIPAFLTLIIIPFTFSITNGIIFGLLASGCFYFTTGQCFKDIYSLCGGNNTNDRTLTRTASGEYTMALHHENEDENQFLDPKPFVRTPSLILHKSDADAVRYARGSSVDSLNNHQSPGSSYQGRSAMLAHEGKKENSPLLQEGTPVGYV